MEKSKELKEELTAEMHYELIGQEISDLDFRVMAVFGAISRGGDLTEALNRFNLSRAEYEENIDRVLSS